MPRFQGENFERNIRLLHELESLAKAERCSPAQLAIAWVMARGDDIVPIAGTSKKQRLEENAGGRRAADLDDHACRSRRAVPARCRGGRADGAHFIAAPRALIAPPRRRPEKC